MESLLHTFEVDLCSIEVIHGLATQCVYMCTVSTEQCDLLQSLAQAR